MVNTRYTICTDKYKKDGYDWCFINQKNTLEEAKKFAEDYIKLHPEEHYKIEKETREVILIV